MRLRESTRPVSRSRGRGFMLTLGGIGVGFALLLLWIGYNAPNNIPGRSYYNLKAQFTDADNLTKSYQVRIGGRLVGQVLDPHVENGKGVVRLQLKPDVKPLLSDTTLFVRPRSSVGVRFVELHPGTKGHPLKDGDEIPSSQTGETVQLDEALGTLDANRRLKAAILLRELGNGFIGLGDQLNEGLKSAGGSIGPSPFEAKNGKGPKTVGGFLENLDRVAKTINDRNGAPTRFIQQSQRAAAAADPVRDVIANGFQPEADSLQAFVNAKTALRKLLDEAPNDLSTIQSGLGQTDPLLRATRLMAAQLGPALRYSVSAMRNTAALLRDARPGLHALPSTLALTEKAVPPTTKVLNTIQPVLPDLNTVFSSPIGILDILGPRGCDIKLFTDNWTTMLGYGSSNGGVLRFNVIGSQESVLGATAADQKLLSGPILDNAYPAPCETKGGNLR